MRASLLLAAAGVLVVTLLPLGCSQESAPRSVLRVVSTNNNEALKSDVAVEDAVQGLVLMEDQVDMEIESSPHDGALDLRSTGPYGHVLLDRYEVRFESPEQIPMVSGSLGWSVATGQKFTGSLTVVTAALKMEPVLVGLRGGGEILTTAHITLFGHEDTSDNAMKVEATLPVHFANWIDKP